MALSVSDPVSTLDQYHPSSYSFRDAIDIAGWYGLLNGKSHKYPLYTVCVQIHLRFKVKGKPIPGMKKKKKKLSYKRFGIN